MVANVNGKGGTGQAANSEGAAAPLRRTKQRAEGEAPRKPPIARRAGASTASLNDVAASAVKEPITEPAAQRVASEEPAQHEQQRPLTAQAAEVAVDLLQGTARGAGKIVGVARDNLERVVDTAHQLGDNSVVKGVTSVAGKHAGKLAVGAAVWLNPVTATLVGLGGAAAAVYRTKEHMNEGMGAIEAAKKTASETGELYTNAKDQLRQLGDWLGIDRGDKKS
jgi:hypothetical protein